MPASVIPQTPLQGSTLAVPQQQNQEALASLNIMHKFGIAEVESLRCWNQKQIQVFT